MFDYSDAIKGIEADREVLQRRIWKLQDEHDSLGKVIEILKKRRDAGRDGAADSAGD